MSRATPIIFVLLFATFVPTAARGQVEDARAQFDAARVAIEEGRFAEARDLLRRSLAAQPARPTAFNLGVALRGIGEVRDSIVVFRQLLSGEYGDLEAEQRVEVGGQLSELRALLARIRVSACGADSVEVRVDGELRATLPRCGEEAVDVDPGEHVVQFDAERASSVERYLVLESGQTLAAEAILEVRPVAREAPRHNGWLWLGVAAAVLAVAAVVVLVALTIDPPTQPHVTDDVYGEIIALRFD